jgi:hypothetical protein
VFRGAEVTTLDMFEPAASERVRSWIDALDDASIQACNSDFRDDVVVQLRGFDVDCYQNDVFLDCERNILMWIQAIDLLPDSDGFDLDVSVRSPAAWDL